MSNEAAALDECEYLFLSDIQELDWNGLSLVVSEGQPVSGSGPLHFGESVLSGGMCIAITKESRVFELIWREYIAYSVLNESYASIDDSEHFEGKRFRIYSKSRFIEYVSRASFGAVRRAPKAIPVLLVVHVYREEDHGEQIIRIISARAAEKHEFRRYREQAID